MANGTSSTEEIIEKRASAPVATACLIIACVAILGAIAFQVAEIAKYRSGRDSISTVSGKGPGALKAQKDIRDVEDEVSELGREVEVLIESVTSGASGGGGVDDLDLDVDPITPPDETSTDGDLDPGSSSS